jgi:hypothetical protein
LNTVDTMPLPFVVTRWLKEGAVQLTEMELLTGEGSATVGWFGSELHSRMLPMEFLANPLPVMVTGEPFTSPVVGVPVSVVAANAEIVEPRSTAPPTTRTEAATIRRRARASRPPGRPAANLDRPDDLFITDPPRRPDATSSDDSVRRSQDLRIGT